MFSDTKIPRARLICTQSCSLEGEDGHGHDCCECGHEKFRTAIMAPQYSMMDTMQSEILRQEELKDMKNINKT